MKKIKLNKNHGILFWITGLSGSGKSEISKKIRAQIRKNYGKTIVLSGDDIRNIFNLKGYSYQERLTTVLKYCKLIKKITSQNINVIFSVIGMIDEIRIWNKKNQKNYIEIYIRTNVKKIIKNKKKKIYLNNTSQLVGIDIKPEFPKNPHIIIKNDFKDSIEKKSLELILKIKKII